MKTQIKNPPHYRPDIDGLRGLAVLSVIIFHAFPNMLEGGFVGVDIFFVISGFLISRIILTDLREGTFSFRKFCSSRIRRILPALILVLSATYFLGWISLLADEYAQLGNHIAAGVVFANNFLLQSEVGYFDTIAEKKPLLHLWSLGVEAQFYIIYTLIIWKAWKHKINIQAITLMIAICSFLWNVRGIESEPIAVFYSTPARLWEFMLGGVLAWRALQESNVLIKNKNSLWGHPSDVLHPRIKFQRKTLNNIVSLIGFGILLFGFLQIDDDLSFHGLWALIPVLGVICIILAGEQAWINKQILSHRIFIWFGLISFPLYLWHWVLLSFAAILENSTPIFEIRIAIVLASVFLAWVTYVFIERPFRYGGAKKLNVGLLVVTALLIGCAGYYTKYKNGLPSRDHIARFEMINQQFAAAHDLGRPQEATIMLLGDSHAAGLIPGLKKYFGLKVADYTSSGCIPFFNVDRYDSRFIKGACAKKMNAALEHFESNSLMTGIILTSMGPVYLTGREFNQRDTARVTGDGVWLINEENITSRWEVYAFGMRDTLARLSKRGKNILFVIDVPELGFDPHTCIESRPFVITPRRRTSCSITRQSYMDRTREYRNLVYSILKDYPNVMVYDPAEHLCDNMHCWAFKDGKPLYGDSDHLSDEGSFYLIRHMRALIEKL